LVVFNFNFFHFVYTLIRVNLFQDETHYFADKDDLVTVMAREHMEHDKVEYEQLRKDSKNAIDELVKISVCLRRDMQDMNPSLLFDLQKFHPKAWSVWLDHKNNYIRNSIMRNIAQGIEEGFFRPEINAKVMAATRLEIIQLGFDNQVFPPEQFNFAEVQMQIFEHFIYGLLTDKGRKVYEKYKQQTNPIELIPQSI
ncbi:MAG: TetR/AcrR family transcriptional regulator, partial [Cyclobacteriaceae bacterium]|nr:TetR/AcrR family transcriptional regulator [Cyclobacteriaceae bacterium]